MQQRHMNILSSFFLCVNFDLHQLHVVCQILTKFGFFFGHKSLVGIQRLICNKCYVSPCLHQDGPTTSSHPWESFHLDRSSCLVYSSNDITISRMVFFTSSSKYQKKYALSRIKRDSPYCLGPMVDPSVKMEYVHTCEFDLQPTHT